MHGHQNMKNAACVTTMWTGFRFCITVVVSWGVLSAVEGTGLEARQWIVSCLSDPCQDQN